MRTPALAFCLVAAGCGKAEECKKIAAVTSADLPAVPPFDVENFKLMIEASSSAAKTTRAWSDSLGKMEINTSALSSAVRSMIAQLDQHATRLETLEQHASGHMRAEADANANTEALGKAIGDLVDTCGAPRPGRGNVGRNNDCLRALQALRNIPRSREAILEAAAASAKELEGTQIKTAEIRAPFVRVRPKLDELHASIAKSVDLKTQAAAAHAAAVNGFLELVPVANNLAAVCR